MLLVGMVDPNSVQITIQQGKNTNVDLTLVTSVKLYVRKPSATTDVVWIPTTEAKTPTSYIMNYKFQTGDLDEEGCYILKPRLYDSTGNRERFCSEIGMQVYKA